MFLQAWTGICAIIVHQVNHPEIFADLSLTEGNQPLVNTLSMTNRKALIVDDEEDTCFLLSMILKQQDWETSFVHSLSEASRSLAAEEPAVIFLDNNLGDGLGVEYIPQIKTRYPLTKVILITAFDTLPTRSLAFENGAHYFVGKPFDKQAIHQALDSVKAGGDTKD